MQCRQSVCSKAGWKRCPRPANEKNIKNLLDRLEELVKTEAEKIEAKIATETKKVEEKIMRVEEKIEDVCGSGTVVSTTGINVDFSN